MPRPIAQHPAAATRNRVRSVALGVAILALSPAAAAAQVPGGSAAPPPPPAVQPPPPPPIALPAPAPPPPQAVGGLTAPAPADPARMAAEIRKAMSTNAFGWQFAISQKGRLVVPLKGGSESGAGGTARTKADNGGVRLKMQPTMRYELASFTKNVTALATMKLLRRKGLSIESPIAPYLPTAWKLSASFQTLKFRHLLAHTSGIGQVAVAYKANDPETLEAKFNNNWDGLQWMAGRTVKPDSQRSYKNANYGILGIINAQLWRLTGGKLTETETIEFENYKGVVKEKTITTTLPASSAAYHARYQMDFQQRHIFTPAGIKNVGCVAPNAKTAGLNYAAGATQSSKGSLLAWPTLICAGNAGLRLSSIEVVRYLVHLRHGKIVHPDDRKKMDELRLGWDEDSNGGDGGQFGGAPDGKPDNALSPGAFWHGGAFNGKDAPQVWTCGMTFSDGTEAALIANSAVKVQSCTVLLSAWNAAKQ